MDLVIGPVQFAYPATQQAPVGSVFVQCDADFGGPGQGRKSMSGAAAWIKMNDDCWYPVYAHAKYQSTVALSSGESELCAAVAGTVEGLGLRQLAGSIVSQGHRHLIVGIDSTAALGVIKRKGASRRTRHIEVRGFFLQDVLRRDGHKAVKISSQEMLADCLTKICNPPEEHLKKLGLTTNAVYGGICEKNVREKLTHAR